MELAGFSLIVILFLFLAAIAAGYLDTLVGGGGLITIPALLMAGLPPLFALGTNKLQAVMGSGTASFMMFRYRKVAFSEVWPLMLTAFIGSLAGTVAVQYLQVELLNILIPIVILVICVYFILVPPQTLKSRESRIGKGVYGGTAVPAIGFYDGMFGPGTGSFLVLAGVSLRGQDILSATATAKTLNFSTNLASLMVFISFGKVFWIVGGIMMLGQAFGANLGARTLFSINPMVLRWLIIAVCLIMLVSWLGSSIGGE